MRASPIAVALLLALAPAARAQELRDGDRVVFYGDSITEAGLYGSDVETWYADHGIDVATSNAGWKSDRVTGGLGGPIDRRLDRDVIARKPTVVTVMLGMNDGGNEPFAQARLDRYERGLEHIVDRLQAGLPDVRIILLEPSAYDDVTRAPKFHGGFNAVLVRYGAAVRDLAARRGLVSIDLNAPLVACLEKARDHDLALARQLLPDRTHPSSAGHLVLADAILRGLGAKPTTTATDVDLAATSVTGVGISDVARTLSGGIAWTQHDRALPFAPNGDALTKLVLRSADLSVLLGSETLRARVTPGRWVLKIDGHRVGAFDDTQLGQGIDLTKLDSPITEQAHEVRKLVQQATWDRFELWRQIEVPFWGKTIDAGDAKTARTLEDGETRARARSRDAARLGDHGFELLPEKPTEGLAGAAEHPR
jgi:lysophospholipase L1-like esterase